MQSGLKEEKIDEELLALKSNMERFRTDNRLETPVGQKLQRGIEELERLVELRAFMYKRRENCRREIECLSASRKANEEKLQILRE